MVAGISWFTACVLSLLVSKPTEVDSDVLAYLITQTSPESGLGHVPPCASQSYYGAYGRPLQHIYGLSGSCFETALSETQLESGSVTVPVIDHKKRTLIWLQDAGVDNELRHGQSFDDSMTALVQTTFSALPVSHDDSIFQQSLHSGFPPQHPELDFVYRSPSAAIISVTDDVANMIDSLLPSHIAPIVLPSSPVSLVPVPRENADYIGGILKKLKFNPDIASVLSTLSVDIMRHNIRHLTGEDEQGILSRHSFSEGALVAADWIQGEFEKSGAKCRQETFLEGYSPNVICRYPFSGSSRAPVLLSAHYDSRGSFGSIRAPGGNDDGSGTTHLLALASAIHQNSIKFTKHPVEFAAFAGEEQGLRGSAAYARKLWQQGRNVTLMIQADMLAYHKIGEPAQLGLPDLIGLPEAAWLVANVSSIYSPELTVGTTPACCSDHQSFNAYGFPATQVYERAGPIVDPMYHNSGDLSDRIGYDLQQVKSIAKVTFATLLEVAGFTWDADAQTRIE